MINDKFINSYYVFKNTFVQHYQVCTEFLYDGSLNFTKDQYSILYYDRYMFKETKNAWNGNVLLTSGQIYGRGIFNMDLKKKAGVLTFLHSTFYFITKFKHHLIATVTRGNQALGCIGYNIVGPLIDLSQR